ncbi:hypothetical protein K0651_10505 [Ornithinimicrobium sp. Arc0846-15]|nr:hypothetical protein [Ornithinimicrobium laminariae]
MGAESTVAYLPDDPSYILPMPDGELYLYEPSSGPQIEYVFPLFIGLAMVALVTHQLLRKEDES